MRAYFKDLLQALRGIHAALLAIEDVGVKALAPRPSDGNLEGRIFELEQSREVFEGNMEGRWLKIDARFNATRSSEERQRRDEAKAAVASEGDAQSEEEFAESYRALLQNGDPPGSPENGLPTVHQALGTPETVRQAVKARKWARG